ncbi:MAG: hypothetical protein L6Q98_03590 [Anaerolineae bacterium]|nr:hypothetical protein [Anaerolineae bacterium]NUQ02322.1 hypothetical protein [Anaerolineae bacterium]
MSDQQPDPMPDGDLHPALDDQVEALYALVRSLFREKVAHDLLDAFEAAFSALPDEATRAEVVGYWLDFYRLQRYKLLRRRRRPKFQERLKACSACGYPTSHRHHLWDVATHGENRVTIQLCANCHELHHLMYNALVRQSEYSRKLVLHALFSGRINRDTGVRILGWCLATIRYEAGNGWIAPGSDRREQVEERLHWSEFLKIQDAQKGET